LPIYGDLDNNFSHCISDDHANQRTKGSCPYTVRIDESHVDVIVPLARGLRPPQGDFEVVAAGQDIDRNISSMRGYYEARQAQLFLNYPARSL